MRGRSPRLPETGRQPPGSRKQRSPNEVFMEGKKGIKILSSASIKHIAVILMVINHASTCCYNAFPPADGDVWFRLHWYLTRASFVLFTFLLSEGMVHTKSRPRYIMSLLFFAAASEMPQDLALRGKILDLSNLNVFFTLALGAFTIYVIDIAVKESKALAVLAGAGAVVLAYFLHTEYSWLGIILILIMYYLREYPMARFASAAGALFVPNFLRFAWHYRSAGLITAAIRSAGQSFLQFCGVTAFIPIFMYNGRKGRSLPKYFYYVFYPAHFLILYGFFEILKLVVR